MFSRFRIMNRTRSNPSLHPPRRPNHLQSLDPSSLISPKNPQITSITHTYNHNPALDTCYADQTIRAHDVHETHEYMPYKTPSALPLDLPLPTYLPHLVYSDQDYRATSCRDHNAASGCRNLGMRGLVTWCRVGIWPGCLPRGEEVV